MRLFTNRTVQIVAVLFWVVFFLAAAREAQASEATVWEVINGWCQILFEMCALRHPLGHATLWDWSRPASHPVILSLAEWGSLSAVGTLAVWARRRRV